jgi:hypothetical protein
MTRKEYTDSVLRKLNEGDPSYSGVYDVETHDQALQLRATAYARTILKLDNLTGLPLDELHPTVSEASEFAPDAQGLRPFYFELPDNFLKLAELHASPWERPLTGFSAEEALAVEADPWARSRRSRPVAVKSGNRVYLFGDADGSEVSLRYASCFHEEGEEGDDGLSNFRLQEAVCYYAASLMRQAQGGDGSYLLARSEELL